MKTLAIVKKADGEVRRISAFQAYREERFQGKRHVYFSIYYPDEEMTLVYLKNTKTAFFRYKKGSNFAVSKNNSPDNGEGESSIHYIAKEALSRLTKLTLVSSQTTITAFVSGKATVEKRFDLENKTYFADVYFNLERTEPKEYRYRWYDQIALEICITHKVELEKAADFEKNIIPLFEVTLPKKTCEKFDLDKAKSEYSDNEIESRIVNMQKMFEKQIFGCFLSNPFSMEYLEMQRYKSEIDKFKSKRDEIYDIVKNLEQIVEPLGIRVADIAQRVEPLDVKTIDITQRIESLDAKVADIEQRAEYLSTGGTGLCQGQENLLFENDHSILDQEKLFKTKCSCTELQYGENTSVGKKDTKRGVLVRLSNWIKRVLEK
ncbi:hypothetical protein KQI11_08145 [Acetanaerobacterium sp. MSJ-12]|uniref:hypothetical protein n=1 Tax=Acetanaerobacterium sp. MSJ-12 TaxID=2841535 RepID=UPI001C0ED456|nr:hypothetical protein [Acetanaerobacterium sp. MSJ-12]MBU5420090.1 hypothetical protein [Acetanaerobacterium sp. MSJ-12]